MNRIKLFLAIAFLAVVVCILFLMVCSKSPQVSTRQVIQLNPNATLPFSSGIVVGNTLYCAGCIGANPQTDSLGKNIEEQTTFALETIKSIVTKAGFTMESVAKVTVYLKSINDFQAMNTVYRTYFPTNPPARETVVVADLVRGSLVEISCIAQK